MSYRAMMLVVLLSLPGAVLTTLAYHFVVAPKTVGIVNATDLWKRGQTQVAEALVQPATSDAQRREALASAQRYGERLQIALDQVARDCRCVLVTSSAVLAGQAPDYTESVARAMAANP